MKELQAKAASIKARAFALELTKGCNLRCGYCYYAGREAAYDPKTTMSREVAEASVERLFLETPPEEPVHVHFFGGEPLLNFPLLRHVVEYGARRAKDEGRIITFEVTTNGTRFTEEIIGFLNAHGVHVAVSFDGPKDVQDVSRPLAQGSSYSLALPGITAFLKSRFGTGLLSKTHASVVITRRELDLVRIVRHLEDLGFQKIILSPATDQMGSPHALTTEDLPALRNSYDALAALHEERLRSGETPSDTWFGGLLAQLVSGKRKGSFCEGGMDYLGVAANGDVALCYRFYENPEFQMGNVQTGIERGVTERLLALPVENKPACSVCWARYFCGGGCHHENMIVGGGLSEPNAVTCEIFRHSMDRTLEMWARLAGDGVNYQRGPVLERANGDAFMENESGTKSLPEKPRRNPGCRLREIRNKQGRKERIVYEPLSHAVLVLNKTASLIFDLCDGSRTVEDLVSALEAKFPVDPDMIRRDVLASLAEFHSKGVLG